MSDAAEAINIRVKDRTKFLTNMLTHVAEHMACHVASFSGEELIHHLSTDFDGCFLEDVAEDVVGFPDFCCAVFRSKQWVTKVLMMEARSGRV